MNHTLESASTSIKVQPRPFEVLVSACDILNVVVYPDRAEVTRVASIPVKNEHGSGEIELSVVGLTMETNLDSIRVRLLGVSSSICEILEVSYEEKYINLNKPTITSTSDVSDEDIEGQIIKQKSRINDELQEISSQVSRLHSRKSYVNAFVEKMLSSSKSTESTVNISSARELLDFHMEETEKVDKELSLFAKQREAKEAELKLLVLEEKKRKPTNDEGPLTRAKNIFAILDIKEVPSSQEIQIRFSYVVSNASWASTYDVRLNSEDNSLALSYFAEVMQSTGEDWKDCNLVLSTSNPTISADPPRLPSKVVDNYGYYGNNNTDRYHSYEEAYRSSFALMENDDDGPSFKGGQQQMQAGFKKAGVEGNGEAGSTLFTIARLVSIASDRKPHKVMITSYIFHPQIVHYAVPSMSAHVFIQAKTKNTSPYPLLASKKVSVFLDGNFVSKSSMKQASSGESFQFYIGVDSAVKVEYLPVKKEEYRKGWMSGSDVRKYYHATILHNTKSIPVRVIMTEALPLSTTDKITVEMLEPAPASLTDISKSDILSGIADDVISTGEEKVDENSLPKDFVTKNKNSNNIVWLKTLKPGEKVEVKFSYRIASPQGSTVNIHDR